MSKMECRSCHQWQLKDNDNYCGYCGHLSINIDIDQEEIQLISEIVSKRKIKFTNSGHKDTRIQIECARAAPDFIRFEPKNKFTVKAGSQIQIDPVYPAQSCIILFWHRKSSVCVKGGHPNFFIIFREHSKKVGTCQTMMLVHFKPQRGELVQPRVTPWVQR